MSRILRAVVRPEIQAVLEEENGHWGAYAPGVPGCVAGGSSAEEAERNLQDALREHFELERMIAEGEEDKHFVAHVRADGRIEPRRKGRRAAS